MKIASIRAFAIVNPVVGGSYAANLDASGRRPAWTTTHEVATPMSKYPRFRSRRTSWSGNFRSVGCLVTADDGSWGFGTTNYGAPVIALINDHLGPLLAGENPMATEKLFDMMGRIASPYSPAGIASYAISAIDLALWDLKGNLLQRPVYELAGGPSREDIACYATGNDTDWHLELGFQATKLACPHGVADGSDGLARNEELVARTREMIGPKVDLMLDCWMSMDVAYVVRLAERLRPYDLAWIEDSLVPEDMGAHRALRDRLPWQTLATGEHWYGPRPFLEAATGRLVDVLQPDLHWSGGFTACQRIAAIADAANLRVVCHGGMNTPYGQHFTLASSGTELGEYFVGGPPGVPLAATSGFPGMALPHNGRLVPSDAPGFGHGLTLGAIEAMIH